MDKKLAKKEREANNNANALNINKKTLAYTIKAKKIKGSSQFSKPKQQMNSYFSFPPYQKNLKNPIQDNDINMIIGKKVYEQYRILYHIIKNSKVNVESITGTLLKKKSNCGIVSDFIYAINQNKNESKKGILRRLLINKQVLISLEANYIVATGNYNNEYKHKIPKKFNINSTNKDSDDNEII